MAKFNLAIAYAVTDANEIGLMDDHIHTLVGELHDESGCGFGMRDLQWYDLSLSQLENLDKIIFLPGIAFVTVTEAEGEQRVMFQFHWNADTNNTEPESTL